MELSVGISKVLPPHLSQIIHRPRLVDLLEKNQEKKLILILGQAAQGKWTLAASYIKKSKIPSPWMSSDGEDSNPINLFYLIVYSLQYVLKNTDFDDLLSHSFDSVVASRSENLLFREWTRSIFEQIDNPIHIVMDGLDRLSSDTLAFAPEEIRTFSHEIRKIPKSAESNFKTTLQRLPKSLEPILHEDFGSCYINLHGNCVILDQNNRQVDAARFLSLMKKGEDKEKGGDVESSLSLYTEAMELLRRLEKRERRRSTISMGSGIS